MNDSSSIWPSLTRSIVTTEVLAEYRHVLSRPKFRIKPDRVAASLALIEKAAIKVTPGQRLIVAKDPDDDIFLECASESQADYLVTGNKRHFPITLGPTRIVNARELLEEIAPDLSVN